MPFQREALLLTTYLLHIPSLQVRKPIFSTKLGFSAYFYIALPKSKSFLLCILYFTYLQVRSYSFMLPSVYGGLLSYIYFVFIMRKVWVLPLLCLCMQLSFVVFTCLIVLGLFSVQTTFYWVRYTASPNVQALYLWEKRSTRGSTKVLVNIFFFCPKSQAMTLDTDWIVIQLVNESFRVKGKDASVCRPAPQLPAVISGRRERTALIPLFLSSDT